ncbi:hypothetical protein AVEN_232530-1, partial [Araneus ventricosus]
GVSFRRGTTPFTALDSIPCGTADTYFRMTSFTVVTDGSVSRYTFDCKNLNNRKSQGARSQDLGCHASEKDQRITRSSPAPRRCTDAAIRVAAPSRIKVNVCSVCRVAVME